MPSKPKNAVPDDADPGELHETSQESGLTDSDETGEHAELPVGSDTSEHGETTDETDAGADSADPGESQRGPRSVISRMRHESEEVLSINGEIVREERIDSLSKNLIDLVASKRNKKILTDRVAGIENTSGHINAILYHGEFKILIPDSFMFDMTDRDYGRPEDKSFSYIISGRLDAEIDYTVTEIDIDNRIAIGNHLDAAKRKKKYYFFDPGFDGKPRIKEGMIVEARVITARRNGIFVDIFGCEGFIPNRELTYTRLGDANDFYKAGDIVQVRIQEIEYGEDQQVNVRASVKATIPDPRIEAMSIYNVDGLYSGKVTMIDEFGIFVLLGNGVECKCEFPKERFPMIGSIVNVRIYRKDFEEKLLWGIITRIIK